MRALLFGAIAGLAATTAMTGVMRRMHPHLPAGERYPLPPRQITERVARMAGIHASENALETAAVVAHFLYGGLTGAAYPLITRSRSPVVGAGYGIATWAASYLGWLPLAGILKPATEHPVRRNLLMLTAHALWGAALASGLREMERARTYGFMGGLNRDAT
ncbi:MAG: hypothetical protein AB7O49_03570 [Sphingomonadales bacterium]